MAESGYGSYAQTGHRERRVKAYLAWVTAQGHIGGCGAGLLLKCHYETVRGFAHRRRSHPTFQTDEGIPVLAAMVPHQSCAVVRNRRRRAGEIFFGMDVKF